MKCQGRESKQPKPKVKYEDPMLTVQAGACAECGKTHYSPEALRYIEQITFAPGHYLREKRVAAPYTPAARRC